MLRMNVVVPAAVGTRVFLQITPMQILNNRGSFYAGVVDGGLTNALTFIPSCPYRTNFQAIRIVACEVILTYTGKLDDASGYFVTGVQYDKPAGTEIYNGTARTLPSEDQILSSYQAIETKVHEGARNIYLPLMERHLDFLDETDNNSSIVTPTINMQAIGLTPGSNLRCVVSFFYEGIPSSDFTEILNPKISKS